MINSGKYWDNLMDIPSVERLQIIWKNPPFLLRKLTISPAMFNSYVTNYQRIILVAIDLIDLNLLNWDGSYPFISQHHYLSANGNESKWLPSLLTKYTEAI